MMHVNTLTPFSFVFTQEYIQYKHYVFAKSEMYILKRVQTMYSSHTEEWTALSPILGRHHPLLVSFNGETGCIEYGWYVCNFRF